MAKVLKRLGAPLSYYVYILKDIIAIFVPRKLFIKYYRYRMGK